LVCDNVYRPSRNFCDGLLARYGIEITYYDPLIGAGIQKLLKPNTRAVLIEAPGSQSFEMPDVYRRSLELGADISMQAVRLHIGLENVDDLKTDLERGFAAFNAA
jgi:cystathionine beta-lyase